MKSLEFIIVLLSADSCPYDDTYHTTYLDSGERRDDRAVSDSHIVSRDPSRGGEESVEELQSLVQLLFLLLV